MDSWSSACSLVTVLMKPLSPLPRTGRPYTDAAACFARSTRAGCAPVSALTSVPIGSLSFDRFEPILPAERYRQLLEAADQARELFAGRRVWNVNSTARGGGVAEMLVSLLAYAHGAGVDAHWIVISGNDPFFTLTKRIHNNLH